MDPVPTSKPNISPVKNRSAAGETDAFIFTQYKMISTNAKGWQHYIFLIGTIIVAGYSAASSKRCGQNADELPVGAVGQLSVEDIKNGFNFDPEASEAPPFDSRMTVWQDSSSHVEDRLRLR